MKKSKYPCSYRLCSIFLVMAMILSFSFGTSGQVYGAGEGGQAGDAGMSGKVPGAGKNLSGITLGDAMNLDKSDSSGEEYMPNAAVVMFRESTEKKLTKSQAKKSLAKGEDGVSDITVEDLWTFSQNKKMVAASSGEKKLFKAGNGGKTYTRVALVTSKTLSANQLIASLKKQKDVKYAEPNYKIRAASVSKDAYSDIQWSMQNTDVGSHVEYQWEKGITGSDSIVAVVDSGVDYTHPDLADNMWENTHYPTLKGNCGYDFFNGDGDPMDDNGHGTHCAGIIGAVGDNDIGISGVNKRIRIMALKTLDSEGSAWLAHEVAAYNYIDQALELGEPVRAINDSWDGGGYSRIFADLIDILGEKGALSVIAAGNERVDNDKKEIYPQNIDTPYSIMVAATQEDGKVTPFSNYGKETVDVAAPGVDILSTVPYDCYNPTIYTPEKQAEVSEHFNDFEGEEAWGIPSEKPKVIRKGESDRDQSHIYLNGELYDGSDPDQPVIKVEKTSPGFLDPDGTSLKLTCQGGREDDIVAITIPYAIDPEAESSPEFSLMCQTRGDENDSFFALMDLPADSPLDRNTLADEMVVSFYYFYEEDEDWYHFKGSLAADGESEDEEEPEVQSGTDNISDTGKRMAVLLIYVAQAGDYSVLIDDMAMSRQTLPDTSAFEKYDFKSGTSMAAPFVSGTVALKAEELGKDVDPETLANETVSMVKEGDLPVIQRGSIDFSRRPAQLPPRMGKVTVDPGKDTLTIHGSGLAPEAGARVEIGDDGDSLKEAEILSASDKALVVKNKGWINNIKTVKVTGADGKTSIKRDHYMVGGKKTLEDSSTAGATPSGTMVTDGKKIYWADSDSGNLCAMNPENPDDGEEVIAALDAKDIFEKTEKKTAEYSMLLGSDLVYSNGSLYNVVEYGMSDLMDIAGEMDEDELAEKAGQLEKIYSSEICLVQVTPGKEGEGARVTNLGDLPPELAQTEDWTMAAYNGKLYFIGGYSYNKNSKGISDKVWIFDPAGKTWTAGPSLPEGRVRGKALQIGTDLVYTMGYSSAQTGQDPKDRKYPANLVFDGSRWRKSAIAEDKALSPHVINEDLVNYDQTDKSKDSNLPGGGDISLVRGGLLYTGLPVKDYGDMFTYQVNKDIFQDTGYNFIQDLNDEELTGITVGNYFYGFAGDEIYRLPVDGGMVNVTADPAANGTIIGTGAYMPGETAAVQVTAADGYKIKSLAVNGKAVSLTKDQTKADVTLANLTADQKVTAAFEKTADTPKPSAKKVKVTVKKKGKGTVTGGGTYEVGKTVTIRVKAKKGWYIGSIKSGKKTVKVKKNAAKKTFKIKNIKKNTTVKVVFKENKKKKK